MKRLTRNYTSSTISHFKRKAAAVQLRLRKKDHFFCRCRPPPFEMAMWTIATVQYNYHISVDKQNYSVPYEYIKQKVDVLFTGRTVEVFLEGNRIASHPQLHGRSNRYSMLETYMPPDRQEFLQWNGERFLNWAEQISEQTATVVHHF